jgi:hypothetical protein
MGVITGGLVLVALGAGACARPPAPSLVSPDPPGRDARIAADAAAVRVYRAGLREVVAHVDARPDLFGPPVPATVPPREAREAVRVAWKRFLDYVLALDAIARYHHAGFAALPPPAQAQAFAVAHGAFVAQYRAALELLDRLDRNPDLLPLLEESMPELGLPRGTYGRVRTRFLNAIRGTEFAALGLVDEETRAASPLTPLIAEDRAAIWRYGHGRGPALTAANALRILQRTGFAAWFPVQAGVAAWMGDTRLGPARPSRITPGQIAALAPVLEAGDILLVRREGYVSNIGIPGFWPHAALYVGTPDERRGLGQDPDVRAWVRDRGEPTGDLERLLQASYPRAYARSLASNPGARPRVLEALSDGVVFTTLEHAADADHLAVLRPRVPPVEKALALVRAFGYAGRPYDFDFDFRTDAALVCSELVYKAYEPGPGRRGLRLPLVEVLGRPVLPPNELVRLFDAELGTPGVQLDLVRFLDGQEAAEVAVERPAEVFRRSWQRPKWSLIAARRSTNDRAP